MSQQVRVERDLVFAGYANTTPNVKGIFMPEKKIFDCGFPGTSTLYGWTSTTGSYGGTLAHAAADGGAMTFTMGGTAEDEGEFYHTAQWSAAYNCGMEAKVKISQITLAGVCVGFVDAPELTEDHMAMEIDTASLRNCSNTADFCGMIFDTDATAKVWYYGASNNGNEGTPIAALGSLAPVAGTYFRVRVQTDTAGNVTFYYNGDAVGYLPAAIAYASSNLLTPYVGFIAHTTVAEICTISRITTWQDCS